MKKFILRTISGTAPGKEYPLPEGREVLVGRLSTADIMVDDVKTSRRHAMLSVSGGQITIVDLGSRNGTFVNNQRVRGANLHIGDTVQIGDCVMVLTTEEMPASQMALPRPGGALSNAERFRGSLREIPLVDLLQMLATARKSGMLLLREGNETARVFLEDGRVYYACTENWVDVDPHKVLYRLLRWNSGVFELDRSDVRPFANPITESTDALLLEGMRQADELRNLGMELPPMDARVTLAKPLPCRLAELQDRDLDFIQLVLDYGTVRGVLDHFHGSDFEGYTYLQDMIARKIVAIAAPELKAVRLPGISAQEGR